MNENGFQTKLGFDELQISPQEDHGFRPYQLFVSSIVGCSGGVLRKILQKMRIQVDDIHISAQVQRNEEKANRIEKIHLTYMIYGENIPLGKVEKALKITRKNCSMIQSVADSINITEEVEIKETDLPKSN